MQGSVAAAVISVDGGIVKLARIGSTGSETIIGLRGEGAILGAEEVMCGAAYTATAIAATEAHARRIPAHRFLDALQSDPVLLLETYEVLSRQSLAALRHSGRLGGDSAKCRLLSFLAELVPPQHRVPGCRIQFPVRGWEVAQLLAMTPWHLSRLLRECETEGILERDRGWLVVRDAAMFASNTEP